MYLVPDSSSYLQEGLSYWALQSEMDLLHQFPMQNEYWSTGAMATARGKQGKTTPTLFNPTQIPH
jgi:hypothetical protein